MATRVFSAADQEEFARWSGDRNPMHMDALAARRTQAGAPVVHGMHLLLWSLDAVLQDHPELRGIQRIRAQFQKFVLVGEEAVAELISVKAKTARWAVSVDGGVRCKFQASFAEDIADHGSRQQTAENESDAGEDAPTIPVELSFADLTDRSGAIRMPSSTAHEAPYPMATERIGAVRMAALAASSTLVGMVCPGLHSIYGELTVDAVPLDKSRNALHFRVVETDERFRTVSMEIEGGGWTGKVEAFLRTPPVAQPGMDDLRGYFPADAFAGVRALIVGGSRGLGELTAKLLAAGGAQTWITYRSGKADAARVAETIQSVGGSCKVVPWDATSDPEPLLERMEEAPTQVYYFPTPTIFRPQARLYQAERAQEFLQVYVDGFWALVQAVRSRNPAVRLYYPSTIYVNERPAGMTEYSMAKAAGEVLCADINAQLAPTRVVVTRLPRLATDQTASITAVETESAVDAMVQVIRSMHSQAQY